MANSINPRRPWWLTLTNGARRWLWLYKLRDFAFAPPGSVVEGRLSVFSPGYLAQGMKMSVRDHCTRSPKPSMSADSPLIFSFPPENISISPLQASSDSALKYSEASLPLKQEDSFLFHADTFWSCCHVEKKKNNKKDPNWRGRAMHFSCRGKQWKVAPVNG